MYDLVQNILGIYRAQLPQPKEEWPDEVKRVVSYIHKNLFHPKLTVGWLREQCRLNGKSFAARFKHYVGQYPKDYILHHRIEMGKILLARTDATLSTVSIALGFTRYSTFCKAFKRHTGQTPKAWRKNSRRKD